MRDEEQAKGLIDRLTSGPFLVFYGLSFLLVGCFTKPMTVHLTQDGVMSVLLLLLAALVLTPTIAGRG